MSCCGKVICSGCGYTPVYDNQGNEVADQVCSFCRTPLPASYKEAMERLTKRVEVGDSMAMYNLGNYRDGTWGLSQDYYKALEFWYQSAGHGCTLAYNNIGCAYHQGRGIEVDKTKANHYY